MLDAARTNAAAALRSTCTVERTRVADAHGDQRGPAGGHDQHLARLALEAVGGQRGAARPSERGTAPGGHRNTDGVAVFGVVRATRRAVGAS